MGRVQPGDTVVPYRTLIRCKLGGAVGALGSRHLQVMIGKAAAKRGLTVPAPYYALHPMIDLDLPVPMELADRKSTRLNSSNRCISYAVLCLKKKKKKIHFQLDKTLTKITIFSWIYSYILKMSIRCRGIFFPQPFRDYILALIINP